MWVEITQIKGKDFIGKLENEPSRLPLRGGDEISFGIEHI